MMGEKNLFKFRVSSLFAETSYGWSHDMEVSSKVMVCENVWELEADLSIFEGT